MIGLDPGSPSLAPSWGAQGAAGRSGKATGQEEASGEAAQVAKLKARDAQVRAHEGAHLAAGGGVVKGGASYTYQRGPDGRNYAVGGEVPVDTSPVSGNPSATLAKAQQIRAAAMAPADPSPQDRAVASQAAAMASRASAELGRKNQGGAGGEPKPGSVLDAWA
jgi:hypothetical protein